MRTPPLPISVCLIAGNEAARIRRALESVAGWTAEIILVLNDNVSDGTDQIAAEFGARIFREPWKGYVAQKNSALEKAVQPWVLGLDADEQVSAALRAEMEQLFANAGPPAGDAFSFPRCTQYCGRWIRHGDWYPDRKIRLWRRGAGHWGGVDPHDAVLVSGKVGRLNGDLLHYSMEDLDHHIRKTMAYSELFRRQNPQRPVGVAELWFRPWWRFVRSYWLRRGFLDGWQGYAVARIASLEVFLRYAKIREGGGAPPLK